MALSIAGWINGITATFLVIYGCIFGLWCIYKSRKNKVKLLSYMGLGMFFFSFLWLGLSVDFITILLTGKNINNSYGLVGILCFMWIPIVAILLNYICLELLFPEKFTLKKMILFSLLIIGIIFEIFLFLDPMSNFNFAYPKTSGEDLIDEPININSPVGIIMCLYIITGLFFLGGGFLFKSLQTKGVVRKKFLYLSLGWFIILFFGFFEVFTLPGPYNTLIRFGLIFSFFLWYIGIREEPVEKIKIKPQKKVKVEGDLFRLTKKPDHITEEEVSISKEKKICLVCKRKAIGFNIFICPQCEAFYCGRCTQALIQLENACWACGKPIDKSKPVKLLKKEEEIDIEISDKK